MSAGRKRGKEWSEVIVEGENISCSHCHEVLSKKIERVRNHLSKCAQYQKSQEVGSGSNNQNSLENEMFEEFMPSKVQKIDQFISKTSDKEREKLDKQIGRAFFANNFSFQSIENSFICQGHSDVETRIHTSKKWWAYASILLYSI